MKIKINENESYEIKLNEEEVSINDLKELVRKIELISEITPPKITIFIFKRSYNTIVFVFMVKK